MSLLSEQYSHTEVKISEAEEILQLQDETTVSASLKGVVGELRDQWDTLVQALDDATDDIEMIESLVELEQAADSVKAAVEADSALAQETRKALLEVHDEISSLKRELMLQHPAWKLA